MLFAILLATQGPAQTVLDEHFTDGDLTFGTDPNDGNFVRQNGTSQSISVVTDNVIGGANALAYSNPSNGPLFIGQFQTPVTLALNQTLEFSFDFRFTSLPDAPNGSIFRFGIYDHAGAAATDGGTETNPDSGYLNDFGAGGSAGDAGWAKETGGGDGLLGGLGTSAIPGTVLMPIDINNTAAHHVLNQLTLTAGGLTLVTFFDGQETNNATDASPFTSFNEVAFRLTGGPATADYDNILVQIVPEPSALALTIVGAALFGLLQLKPSRART